MIDGLTTNLFLITEYLLEYDVKLIFMPIWIRLN